MPGSYLNQSEAAAEAMVHDGSGGGGFIPLTLDDAIYNKYTSAQYFVIYSQTLMQLAHVSVEEVTKYLKYISR